MAGKEIEPLERNTFKKFVDVDVVMTDGKKKILPRAEREPDIVVAEEAARPKRIGHAKQWNEERKPKTRVVEN